MRAWMVVGAAMLVGVGAAGLDRVVPLPVYAAEQAAGEAARCSPGCATALGGTKVEQVKTLSVEGPFRARDGPAPDGRHHGADARGPDKMHQQRGHGDARRRLGRAHVAPSPARRRGKTRRTAAAWAAGCRYDASAPAAREMNEAADREARTRRLTAEMQRWMLALLGGAGRRSHLRRHRRVARRQGRYARDEGRARPGPALLRRPADAPAADAGVPGDAAPMMMQGGPGGAGGPGGRRRSRAPGPGGGLAAGAGRRCRRRPADSARAGGDAAAHGVDAAAGRRAPSDGFDDYKSVDGVKLPMRSASRSTASPSRSGRSRRSRSTRR